jgi:5-methylcytosine-specific restriction protein A
MELLEREPLCRKCRYMDKVSSASQVDHIRPVSKGGEFFDIENLQPLCNSCHASKSAKEGNRKP